MGNITIRPAGGPVVKISPDAFRLWARDYFKCYLDFQSPRPLTTVPFFLCCRAIELALKGSLLDGDVSRDELKRHYSHDLLRAYRAIPQEQQTLSESELKVLDAANSIYREKRFEYFDIMDAVSAYKHFPDLPALADLARKLTGYTDPAPGLTTHSQV